MSSPMNLQVEGRSPSARIIQLDVEETMPQSPNRTSSLNSSQFSNYSASSSPSNSPSRRTPHNQPSDIMEGEVVPSRMLQEQKEDNQKIPENKCKVKGHKRDDLIYICTLKGCNDILMCKRCKRKHNKDHQSSIKLLDDWFNNMFGRRVEDSDNNKVSRKCGMNIGKLQEQLRSYQSEIETRKATIEKQSQQFIEMITSYIKQKQNECIKRLEGHYSAKNQQLDEYQQTYKKLKGLNRFTILENLKRQHNPNAEQPPLIPIQSILKFLLENEKQYSDSQQIENQHKGFSKLIRDTENLEQAINNEIKQLTKLASTDEGKPDYLIRDSPVIQRIQDYIDFLYFFEKGIPKKTQAFFRSGTLNFDEEDYSSQLNQQAGVSNNNSNNISSINLSFSNQCQRMQSRSNSTYKNAYNQTGDSTSRRRLTIEEMFQYSRPRQQSQGNMLKQIQQQDEGDFIMQKQKEQKLQNTGKEDDEDEEKEEVEYECLVQENFNNAQFIDFKNDSIRVFGDQQLQIFDINGGMFNKKDNFKAQQQIISHDQEMYEIGAIEEVYFFQSELSLVNINGLQSSIKGFDSFNKIGSDTLKNDSILADDDTAHLIDLNSTTQFTLNPQKKKLPLIIIGLKSDPAKIEIWDMNKNEKIIQYLQAHDCSITCIQILEVVHNKSILFAVGSYDGLIKTWLFTCTHPETNGILGDNSEINSPEKIQPVYTLTQQLTMKCHTDFVTSMIKFCIKDDPAKDYLISAGSDKKMILWNWKTEEENSVLSALKQGAAPPPQNNNSNTTVQKENKETSQQEGDSQGNTTTNAANDSKPAPAEEPKKKAPFLKKQIKLISLSKNTAASSNSNSNSENASNQQKAQNEKTLRKPLKVMDNVHSDKINCFEKLDEGFLATGSSDNTIKIWDMDTQTEQKVLQNKYIVNNICRLKRGTLVCSANNVKMSIYLVNIWNWEQGQIIGTIKGHTNRITKIHVIPNLFAESPIEPLYSKIITCERNKVIRVWKQSNVELDYGRPLNSQEDEVVNSPSSIRSHYSRTYSLYYKNPAEDFLNLYHLEMDPSLTPKLNMARIASQTSLPSGPHDKTPISNLIRGAGFNGQTTPSNSNLYFSSQQNSQSIRHQQYPSFSQQNNLLEKQYYQFTQQVQQVNNVQALVKSTSNTNFTPPKNNTTFQFSPDEQPQQQNLLNFSPLPQNTQITNMGSPQLPKPLNGPLPNLQQLPPQLLQNSGALALNQGSLFLSSNDMINIPANNNINNINNLFSQPMNMAPELQKAMEQVIIQNTLATTNQTISSTNNQPDQEQQQVNLAPSIDLSINPGQQQMLEQALQEQIGQRKRNFSEVGHMLAPLEEANESEYNSPVDSQNEVYHPHDNMSSFSIDSSKFKYSRENSNENCEQSLYQPSPASKQYLANGNHQIITEENRIFKNCGPFSQIAERSPGSESSSSSGNLTDPLQLNREGSNNFSNDFVLQHKLSGSVSSPNSSDYPKNGIDSNSMDQVNSLSNSQDNTPQKQLRKSPINYQIKLNGVHKYGSLEINGTSNDSVEYEKSHPDSSPPPNTQIDSESKNENKNQENVNQQNLLVETSDTLKVDDRQSQQDHQFSSATLIPPDDKKGSNFSQSAPTSPSLPSSNPLLKNKAAMLQKTKKSSRNIFQN